MNADRFLKKLHEHDDFWDYEMSEEFRKQFKDWVKDKKRHPKRES